MLTDADLVQLQVIRLLLVFEGGEPPLHGRLATLVAHGSGLARVPRQI